MAGSLADATARALQVREDAPRRSGDPPTSICDPSRANTILGWKPKYDLRAMARTAWQWHSTHPDGFATTA
jgi:UDP-glucose 4-epimerase